MRSGVEKNILDVGCAYGPFLAAARDAGWKPFGTDISDDAVAYVRDQLSIPAWVAPFPAPDSTGEIERRQYAALSMWYVIEHFRSLSPVLECANRLLVSGGILAFSTPSAAGVSARFSPESFYRQSPSDHYSIWDPRTVRAQLARYGFFRRQDRFDRPSSGTVSGNEERQGRRVSVKIRCHAEPVSRARRHL